jgi:hypothetical protein
MHSHHHARATLERLRVLNLRGMGLIIETIHESHDGPFSGTHARYVLHSQISILEGVL